MADDSFMKLVGDDDRESKVERINSCLQAAADDLSMATVLVVELTREGTISIEDLTRLSEEAVKVKANWKTLRVLISTQIPYAIEKQVRERLGHGEPPTE